MGLFSGTFLSYEQAENLHTGEQEYLHDPHTNFPTYAHNLNQTPILALVKSLEHITETAS